MTTGPKWFELSILDDDPSGPVDLVKRTCRHDWTKTVWELHIGDGQLEFSCSRCGLAPDPELMDFVRDYMYSPGALARVRLGPVEVETGGRWDAPEYEPVGVPVRLDGGS